jgi:hypothetical protein
MTNVNNETIENDIGLVTNGKRYRRQETQHKKHVNWRRNKTLTLLTQGCSTYEIAEVLKISQSTAARDVQWLRRESEQELRLHVNSLPHEYRMAYRGLSEALKYAWGLLISGEGQRNKTSILSLITDIYSKRMDLCTNAGVIQESLALVHQARREVKDELHKRGR